MEIMSVLKTFLCVSLSTVATSLFAFDSSSNCFYVPGDPNQTLQFVSIAEAPLDEVTLCLANSGLINERNVEIIDGETENTSEFEIALQYSTINAIILPTEQESDERAYIVLGTSLVNEGERVQAPIFSSMVEELAHIEHEFSEAPSQRGDKVYLNLIERFQPMAMLSQPYEHDYSQHFFLYGVQCNH